MITLLNQHFRCSSNVLCFTLLLRCSNYLKWSSFQHQYYMQDLLNPFNNTMGKDQ